MELIFNPIITYSVHNVYKEQNKCLESKQPECWNRLQAEFFNKFRLLEKYPNIWIYNHEGKRKNE